MGNSHADYYGILNVPVAATAREITRAYRGLLRRFHPDTRQVNRDGGTSAAGDLQRLHEIMQAYAVLSDPAKRAAYDRARRTGSSAGTPAGANGIPVKVRFHPQPGAGSPKTEQPFSYGPTRWSPLPGRGPTFPRRSV